MADKCLFGQSHYTKLSCYNLTMSHKRRYPFKGPIIIGALSLLFVISACFGFYKYSKLQKTYQNSLVEQKGIVSNYEIIVADLKTKLDQAVAEILTLTESLHISKEEMKQKKSEVENLYGKVDTLEKLTRIDPELLKKYSKVYFLNENYAPSSLIEIEKEYQSDKNRFMQIHSDVWPHLQAMIDESKKEDLTILVASSYRSYGTQEILKTNYKITYGTTSANRFSADQGYSEHQLGTTVDLTKTGTLGASFDQTNEYKWLQNNAHKYGFVLSYPKGNKYYIYEPWHWRYVGVKLATMLYDTKKFLYDVDQREIDSYLIEIF